MGQDRAIAECLEAEAAEEAPLDPLDAGPRHDVGLLIGVDRGSRVLAERPVRPPRGKDPGGPAVALFRVVAGLRLGQIEPDDVPGVAAQEPMLLIRRDHVVRGAQDERQVPHCFWAEAEGAEWSDVGHGFLGGPRAHGARTPA
jgi:hypothetical protein